MNSLDKFTQPKRIPKSKREETIFDEYDVILKELREMERNAKYSSENREPELPPNGSFQEVGEKKLFTGFGEKIGVGEFCFGIKDAKSGKYRYLTQDYFDGMVEKLRSVLDAHKKATARTWPNLDAGK